LLQPVQFSMFMCTANAIFSRTSYDRFQKSTIKKW
jgi:hypothetical protein